MRVLKLARGELYYWLAMCSYMKATGDMTPVRDWAWYIRRELGGLRK